MSETADLVIVGGGAAGLAAAIFAGQAGSVGRRIIVLDGAKTIGAKILVSGGGRCNVTHDVVAPGDYNGPQNVIRNILAAFDAAAAVRWFASLGVELKREETGKLFPVSNSARTVLNALTRRCEELKVMIRGGCRVTGIAAPSDLNTDFVIEHTGGLLRSQRVILATGGRSLPRSGSDGSGWELAKDLGHDVTSTYAALVPLVLGPNMFHKDVAGITHDVELSTYAGQKLIDRRAGSLLWTHFGISGPVVMDASRHWTVASETGEFPKMTCNFAYPDRYEATDHGLVSQCAERPKTMVLNILSMRWPERLAMALLGHAGIPPATPMGQLSRDARRALVHALTALPLDVQHHRGWNYAEVTAGGVPLKEIDYRTMESRKVRGLHLTGEILDCDGRIGGFNFQWAWATGYLAGNAAVKAIANS